MDVCTIPIDNFLIPNSVTLKIGNISQMPRRINTLTNFSMKVLVYVPMLGSLLGCNGSLFGCNGSLLCPLFGCNGSLFGSLSCFLEGFSPCKDLYNYNNHQI